ncbi:hypothetical protein BDE36_3502 [Arcticibacter tournemirensis]|nr:hypothetical protein BDE36_3502 [Arcticibacter tournemirensis]
MRFQLLRFWIVMSATTVVCLIFHSQTGGDNQSFDLKPHHLIEEDDESEYYDTDLLINESLTLAFVTTAMRASGILRWVLYSLFSNDG